MLGKVTPKGGPLKILRVLFPALVKINLFYKNPTKSLPIENFEENKQESDLELSWKKSKSVIVNDHYDISLSSPSEKITSSTVSDNDIWKAKNLDKLQYSSFQKLHKRFFLRYCNRMITSF